MGLSRQESWSGLTFPPPGDLHTQGSNPHLLCLLHCRQILYPLSQRGSPPFYSGASKSIRDFLSASSCPYLTEPFFFFFGLKSQLSGHSFLVSFTETLYPCPQHRAELRSRLPSETYSPHAVPTSSPSGRVGSRPTFVISEPRMGQGCRRPWGRFSLPGPTRSLKSHR